MSELQTIISYLNESPYQQNLTLVSLDAKTYQELLEVLILVLHEIDASQKDDLNPNLDSDQLITDLLNCLKLLNCPVYRENPSIFEQELRNNENRNLICNVLFWLLTKQQELKTRAYVAKYLKSFKLPQEFLVDPILYDLLEELKQKRGDFKKTHKEMTQIMTDSNHQHAPYQMHSVQSLKQELRQLKMEKEQLIDKLSHMKNKVLDMDYDQNAFKNLLQFTSCLRKYQEEEQLLFERGHQQRRELNESSKHLQNLISNKDDLQTILESDDILNGLTNKIESLQCLLRKLDEEYTENEQLLNETFSMINSEHIYTEIDVENLENHLNETQKTVDELEKRRDELLEAMDSKLGFYKKRAMKVHKKKNAASNRLNSGKKEIRDLRADIIKLDGEMDKLSVNGRRAMGESELKQYMNCLRSKTQKYKECKSRLQSDRNEMGILQRTNEILRARNDRLPEYLEMKEKEEEMNEKRNALQKVSAMKNAIDLAKEKKLTNVADVAMKINNALKLKKNKLQPLIKKLKQKRNEFKICEEKYVEKKKMYENMRIGTDSELNKLQNNVDSLRKMVNNLETRYHRMKTQIEINNIRLEKVEMEEKYQNGLNVLDKHFKCNRDLYDSEISKLLILSKSLRSEQANIRESHKENIKQKEYFIELKELMTCKLEVVRDRVQEITKLNQENEEDEDRLVLVD